MGSKGRHNQFDTEYDPHSRMGGTYRDDVGCIVSTGQVEREGRLCYCYWCRQVVAYKDGEGFDDQGWANKGAPASLIEYEQ